MCGRDDRQGDISMKGNGKELSAKINEIIKEEITGLSLPLITTIEHLTKISIVIADGYTNINGIDIRITIKLNKQGYWIDIGGLIKMAKTVDQLNKILNIDTHTQSINKIRNSFIEKLRKSGLEEIKSVQPTDHVSSPLQSQPSRITGFKIDDTRSIWVFDWLKTNSPLCNKIVGFSDNSTSCYNYFKPEHFKKELEEFLSEI